MFGDESRSIGGKIVATPKTANDEDSDDARGAQRLEPSVYTLDFLLRQLRTSGADLEGATVANLERYEMSVSGKLN